MFQKQVIYLRKLGLKVLLHFKTIDLQQELDKQECWIKVICTHCKKHVFVKKGEDDMLDYALIQVVLSVWFVHVFSLENVPNSRWYNVNKNWNVCTCRKTHVFNKLKVAFSVDNVHLFLPDDNVAYYQSLKNLDGLWEAIDRKMPQLYTGCCRIAYIIESKMTQGLETRNYRKTYSERQKELLNTIAPNKRYTDKALDNKEYKKEKNLSNRIKNKRDREVKTKRHKAELEWKPIFHNDLDLQLKFRYIEYVDVATSEELDPVSEEYVASEKEKRQNRRRKQSDGNHNYNHYLMYESKGKSPHVIDEDWFEEIDDVTKEVTRRISEKTVERCETTPNRVWNLSTADLCLIKRHVNSIKLGSPIHRIKCVVEAAKEQAQEFVTYKGNISSSRFAFVRYDRKKHYYNVSVDWVEINFKTSNPNIYYNIMALQPG